MTELIGIVGDATLPAFLTALLVFGFAPGFVLRLLVKLYPKDDPRRAELVAELYVIPRLMRPMWVAEQIEVALFDGLGSRRQARRRRRQGRRASRTARFGGLLLVALNGVAVLAVFWANPGNLVGRIAIMAALIGIGAGMWFMFSDLLRTRRLPRADGPAPAEE